MNHSRRVHVNLYNSALVNHYYNTNSLQYIIVILNSNTRGLLRINSDPDLISYPYANPAICSQITLRLSFTPLSIFFGASEVSGDEVERATLSLTTVRSSSLNSEPVLFLNDSENFDSLDRFNSHSSPLQLSRTRS
jgi:hypothetical protein